MLMMRIDNEMALVRVKDERNKTSIPAKAIWMAIKHFNMKNVQLSVDADGFEVLHGMNRDLLYHDEHSLREQGLREIPRDPYPSPYGGSLYYNDALWKATREIINVEGRNWENLQIAVWEKLKEIVDMSDYYPRGDEKDEMQKLKQILPPAHLQPRAHLVISATSKDQDAIELGKRFSTIGFDDVIFTALDESFQHGVLLNFQDSIGKPFYSFGIGPRVPEDYESATKERIIDLLMGQGSENLDRLNLNQEMN